MSNGGIAFVSSVRLRVESIRVLIGQFAIVLKSCRVLGQSLCKTIDLLDVKSESESADSIRTRGEFN